MRKNIFDIVAESIDMESEANRLVAMSSEENVLVVDYYTYKRFLIMLMNTVSKIGHNAVILLM